MLDARRLDLADISYRKARMMLAVGDVVGVNSTGTGRKFPSQLADFDELAALFIRLRRIELQGGVAS